MHKSIFFLSILMISVQIWAENGSSYYTRMPDDPEAVYFTPENFNITNDGKTDVTNQLQEAINQLKQDRNFGILFIPEGTYTISRTIYIPPAIRLIGYGEKRPVIVLKKNSPGYQEPVQDDKGKANYMIWFTGRIVQDDGSVGDAGAGTFYSALSNIDIKIESGNPEAVALRTHFAQHSFIAHSDIYIGDGKAGLFDVGNMIEDVRFFGGDYGIYTTKTSPGWQFMMVDCSFEGQRRTAIKTQEAGFTIVRMHIKDCPAAILVDPNYWEKLILEDCIFENITKPAIVVSNEGNANMQLNIRNLACKNVPVLVEYPKDHSQTQAPGKTYRVNKLIYGLQMEDIDEEAVFKTTFEADEINRLPEMVKNIPKLPAMEQWVNLKSLGAKGDGITDDTKAIQKTIDSHSFIYVPQGSYLISETLKMKPNTVLIGLHPLATNFTLKENAEAFGGFGGPKSMIESPEQGNNIITGIGLSTGACNYRAVACKWMSGENSMVDDVKFIGGHGTMRPGPKVSWKWQELNRDNNRRFRGGTNETWDTQYWSLWVTNGGGGIFKNIWSANTYATSGIYVSNTKTPGHIYAMSVEHHVRNEVRFNNVSNWKIYALQLEEESAESSECQPMEIGQCSNLIFSNLYMFRVIRVKVPYPYSVRTWDCSGLEFLNVHNYSQIKYTTDNPLYDINTDTEVRPVEFARLFVSGEATRNSKKNSEDLVQLLAKGFEFAVGMCHDSKGNIYFSEQRMKRIYKWSVETESLSLLADFPWQPLSLACDSKDNLLVVFRYDPQPGLQVNGQEEHFSNPPDADGTSFSKWGNSGFGTLVYSIDPQHPDETISLLKKVKMGSIIPVYKALYPSNRWRDFHDFNEVSLNRNEECWLAPDGKTIVPICYDLARSCALVEAFPGKTMYAADEYDKRTVSYKVDEMGYLSDLKYVAEKGEFSSIPDMHGNLYVADGELYIYNKNGEQTGLINIPERPATLSFGGNDGKTLYVSGRSALYRVNSESQN